MNEKNPDILISAYFDGELTPTEREMVEQHLATSPEAQQELHAFSELRSLLQSLPRETVSDDFTAEVLQKSERASLLPVEEPVISKPEPGRSSQPRLFVVGSLIATAAALLLMTKLLTSTQPGAPNERSTASNKSSDQNVAAIEKGSQSRDAGKADNSGSRPMSSALSAVDNVDRKNQGSPESVTGRLEGPPSGAKAFKFSGPLKKNFAREGVDSRKSVFDGKDVRNKPSAPGNSVAGAKGAAGNQSRLLSKRGANRDAIRREVLKKLKNGMIQIGDVVPYFENRGGRTAVVEVVVVDVQKTVNEFQLLLVENAVPSADDKDPRKEKSDTKRMLKSADDGQEMIALYVESSQLQMTTAMKWLTRDAANRQIALKPPVELENILLADSGNRQARPESKSTTRGTEPRSLAEAIEQNRLQRNRASRKTRRVGNATEEQNQPGKGSSVKKKAAPTKQDGNAKPSDKKDGSGVQGEGSRFASPKGSDADKAFHLLVRVPKNAIAQRTIQRKRTEFRKFGQGQPQQRSNLKTQSMRSRNASVAPLRVIFVFRKPAERKPVERKSGR